MGPIVPWAYDGCSATPYLELRTHTTPCLLVVQTPAGCAQILCQNRRPSQCIKKKPQKAQCAVFPDPPTSTPARAHAVVIGHPPSSTPVTSGGLRQVNKTGPRRKTLIRSNKWIYHNAIFDSNCGTLLHMQTRTCMCGALCDLLAAACHMWWAWIGRMTRNQL